MAGSIFQSCLILRLAMTPQIPQIAQAPEVPFPALLCEFGAVELPRQITKSLLQLRDAHAIGLEVDIEQGAQLPGIFPQDPPFLLQPVVERRAGEGRQYRDLHLVEPAGTDEFPCLVETRDIGAVETEYEATASRDAAVLQAPDRPCL